MSTLMSNAIAKQYSHASCWDETKGTEHKTRWQSARNKWFSLIRKHISWPRLLWMTGRRSFVGPGCERGRLSQLLLPGDKKCWKPALQNLNLPGFPTTSTPRFDPSFLRLCRPTSQEFLDGRLPNHGRSPSPRILLIQAFENTLLVRGLPPLARDEIPLHSHGVAGCERRYAAF